MKFRSSYFVPFFLVGILLVIGGIFSAVPQGVAGQSETLNMAVEPGTLDVRASWGSPPDATSYRVRWRLKGEEFTDGDMVTVTDPEAEFSVTRQGIWRVRVEACNDEGCTHLITDSVRVVINVPGHEAVRQWIDEEGIHLDWDRLPGQYVVKYRIAGWDGWASDTWYTSEPQSEVGYTLSFADAVPEPDSEGADEQAAREYVKQHPMPSGGVQFIFRVYFGCDETGEGCSLMGRVPNNSLEAVDFGSTPPVPFVGASGSSDSVTVSGPDPLTGMTRHDLTLTSETDDGYTRSCLSRPAENTWERATAGNTVKRCFGATEVTDLYLFDPNAQIADGERCEERPAENDGEREVFGETVKVCNEHAEQGGYSDTSDVTGQDHVSAHRPRIRRVYPLRSQYGDYDHTAYCTSAQLRQQNYHDGYNVTTAISIYWCHDNGSRVQKVQTIVSSPQTYTDSYIGDKYKFCEWVRSPIAPYDVLWRYFHADAGGYAYLEYGSRIEARYGNQSRIDTVDIPIYVPSLRRWIEIPIPVWTSECSTGFFNSRAAIVGENDGGSRIWRD